MNLDLGDADLVDTDLVGADLVLVSPLDGWCAPLAETPDPVFAEAMLGDGVAIDPTGSVLHAPCDAMVVAVHAAPHAITLRAAGGLELLLHIGLETVSLGGEGFEVHVADGQFVRQGERLISFDLDFLAARARSLITPGVLVGAGGFAIAQRFTGRAVRAGEPILRLAGGGVASRGFAAAGPQLRPQLRVPLAHGLHARPAARVADCAKGFVAEVAIGRAGRSVSARSPVALMSLGLRHGDEATLTAAGPDAEAALEAGAALIESGMGEGKPFASSDPVAAAPPAPLSTGVLRGVTASPGLAIGRAARRL